MGIALPASLHARQLSKGLCNSATNCVTLMRLLRGILCLFKGELLMQQSPALSN